MLYLPTDKLSRRVGVGVLEGELAKRGTRERNAKASGESTKQRLGVTAHYYWHASSLRCAKKETEQTCSTELEVTCYRQRSLTIGAVHLHARTLVILTHKMALVAKRKYFTKQ